MGGIGKNRSRLATDSSSKANWRLSEVIKAALRRERRQSAKDSIARRAAFNVVAQPIERRQTNAYTHADDRQDGRDL